MSGAIVGFINLHNNYIEKNIGQAMLNRLNIYKLDKIKDFYKDNIFMGCGLLHITEESLSEILPFYDEIKGLIITADAIIDNREELFLKFNIDKGENVSDSELILKAYKKWGENCPKYLIGDFSFAIWNEKKQELFCARDYVGSRSFYYSYSEDNISFSTLMKPLFETLNGSPTLNKQWIADFLSLETIAHEIDCEKTIYNDIYELPPASIMIVNKSELAIKQYWSPLNLEEIKYNTDKEYENAFNNIFQEAVRCRLRTKNSVGIMVSGGLDSGSVASVAADILSKANKELKAYTSVPVKSFKNVFNKRTVIADEREYVQAIVDKYKNININYISAEGTNCYKEMGNFIEIMEQPYKFIENSQWVDEIYKESAKDNCSVLLSGSFGNFSISYGHIYTHLKTLFDEGKLIKFLKEAKEYGERNKLPFKYLSKEVGRIICPYKIRKIVSDFLVENDILEGSLVNKDFAKEWKIHNRFITNEYNEKPKKFRNLEEMRVEMSKPEGFTHTAAIETKFSLYYGIISRDPTRDKRVIEFCYSLPTTQMVKGNEQRSLIRRSMEGVLPDKVRLNEKWGLQSSDWIQRLHPSWSEIQEDINEFLENKAMGEFFYMDKIKEILKDIGQIPNENHWENLRNLLICLNFLEFYNEFLGEENKEKVYNLS
ncbi:asparagine synthase-related protein [Clostridium tarantellae]|nr:asparagine synthase-related protein [Clostridium tarantellae]